MKAMMWLCGVALVGGCVDEALDSTSSVEQPAGSQVVVHTVFNGGMAGTSYWDPNTNFGLNAYENKNPQGKLTHLSFSFWGIDPTTLECPPWAPPWDPMWGPNPYCFYRQVNIWGMGTIPNEDFEIHPTGKAARLHTTTGPDFFVQTCTFTGCTFGDPYSFDLVFTANGSMHVSQSGTTVHSGGPGPMPVPDPMGQNLQIRTSGTYTQQGAFANGTAFGVTITNGFGGIAQANQTTVMRDLISTSP